MPSSHSSFSLIQPRAVIRTMARLAVLSLLSACATHTSPQLTDESSEAADYAKRATGDYQPPGSPDDPWGPYIEEAAKRFDVPERWIREVMRVESGGNLFLNGQLITSPVGAMGLMQVMPQTYDELRVRYALGDDAYDPHNNILAGAAYMREMYDLYGSPAFLAAYNAGPGRVDDYMQHARPLPEETRRYIAMIAPYIQEAYPHNRSSADQLAMNQPGGFEDVFVPRVPHNPRGYLSPAVVLALHRAGIHPHIGHFYSTRYAMHSVGHHFVTHGMHYARLERGRHYAHGRIYLHTRTAFIAPHARVQYVAMREPSGAHWRHGLRHAERPARFQLAMAAAPAATFRLVSEAIAASPGTHLHAVRRSHTHVAAAHHPGHRHG